MSRSNSLGTATSTAPLPQATDANNSQNGANPNCVTTNDHLNVHAGSKEIGRVGNSPGTSDSLGGRDVQLLSKLGQWAMRFLRWIRPKVTWFRPPVPENIRVICKGAHELAEKHNEVKAENHLLRLENEGLKRLARAPVGVSQRASNEDPTHQTEKWTYDARLKRAKHREYVERAEDRTADMGPDEEIDMLEHYKNVRDGLGCAAKLSNDRIFELETKARLEKVRANEAFDRAEDRAQDMEPDEEIDMLEHYKKAWDESGCAAKLSNKRISELETQAKYGKVMQEIKGRDKSNAQMRKEEIKQPHPAAADQEDTAAAKQHRE